MWIGRIVSAAIVSAALALPGAAWAVTFTGDWSVTTLSSSDPGLVVNVDPFSGGGTSPDLDVGESVTFKLFRIWTTEKFVNPGEDTMPKPIKVAFNFTNPVMSGTVSGSTQGVRTPSSGIFSGLFQKGKVTWDAPLVLNFGPQDSGQASIVLHDATFNKGVFGLFGGEHFGKKFGADVKATLSYDVAPVPVPAALPLLVGGMGLLGFAGRRRRRTTVA